MGEYQIILGQAITMPGKFVIGIEAITALLADGCMLMFDYSPEICLSFTGDTPSLVSLSSDYIAKFESRYPADSIMDLPREYKYVFDKNLDLMTVEESYKPVNLDICKEVTKTCISLKPLFNAAEIGLEQIFAYLVVAACTKEAEKQPYVAYTSARLGIYLPDKEPLYTNYIVSKDIFEELVGGMFGEYSEYSEVKFWALAYACIPEIAESLKNITLTTDFLRILGK